VVPAFDLIERIAQRLEEVIVGIEDRPVHREFDDRLRFANRGNLPGIVGKLLLVNCAAMSAMTILGCGSFMLRVLQYCNAGGRNAAGTISPAETRLSFHFPRSFAILVGYFAATGS
jgi:hypothetical protein